jgi:hypothetical protein
MALDPGPDAYAIFARSRAAVTAARYPDSLQYTISVAGMDGTPHKPTTIGPTAVPPTELSM